MYRSAFPRTIGVIMAGTLLAALTGCQNGSVESKDGKVVDPRSEQELADDIKCEREYHAKRDAYIKRYGQEPQSIRDVDDGSDNRIGCPTVSEEPPLPSIDQLMKNRKTPKGTPSPSGYEAGRLWAEENDIIDPDECLSPSASFESGCRGVAETNDAEPVASGTD
jgi:hypothetical protein